MGSTMRTLATLGLVALAAGSVPHYAQKRQIQVGVDEDAGIFTGAVNLVLFQPALSPSTVYATRQVTVLSCGPEVTNCPLRSQGAAPVVTVEVSVSTTICPVTLTSTTLASYTTPVSASTEIPTDVSQLINVRSILDPATTSLVLSGISHASNSVSGSAVTLGGSVIGSTGGSLSTWSQAALSTVSATASYTSTISNGIIDPAFSLETAGVSFTYDPAVSGSVILSGVASLASGSVITSIGESEASVVSTLSYTYDRTISIEGSESVAATSASVLASGSGVERPLTVGLTAGQPNSSVVPTLSYTYDRTISFSDLITLATSTALGADTTSLTDISASGTLVSILPSAGNATSLATLNAVAETSTEFSLIAPVATNTPEPFLGTGPVDQINVWLLIAIICTTSVLAL